MPYRNIWQLFYKYLEQHNLYVQGVTSRILLEERHSRNSWCCMYTFKCWKNQNETIFDQYIKCDTSSDDMKEKIDHWLDSFEKFHKKYNIMPTESYYYSFTGDSRYITVRSRPGFINEENEMRCYFNSTPQLLYYNVLFRKMIININWYTMMISLDKKQQSIWPSSAKHHDCERVTEMFWWDVFKKKIITTDGIFIIINVTMDCQMYAAEFEGLFYTIFS